MSEEMCHCGRPLHYNSSDIKAVVSAMVAEKGPRIEVTGPDGRKWLVPRHYIALHGLKPEDLPNLGFEEVKAGTLPP